VDYNIRVNAKKLASLMRYRDAFATAASPSRKKAGCPPIGTLGNETAPAVCIVAGSKPPASGAIWSHWEDAGFRVS
jgi:hypothetical protein